MGSLKQYLKNNNPSRQSILTIIKGTAAGLLHLHQEKIGKTYYSYCYYARKLYPLV